MRRKILTLVTSMAVALLAGLILGAFMSNESAGVKTEHTEEWINNHCKPIFCKFEGSNMMSSAIPVYNYTLTDCKGEVYSTGYQFMNLRDTLK